MKFVVPMEVLTNSSRKCILMIKISCLFSEVPSAAYFLCRFQPMPSQKGGNLENPFPPHSPFFPPPQFENPNLSFLLIFRIYFPSSSSALSAERLQQLEAYHGDENEVVVATMLLVRTVHGLEKRWAPAIPFTEEYSQRYWNSPQTTSKSEVSIREDFDPKPRNDDLHEILLSSSEDNYGEHKVSVSKKIESFPFHAPFLISSKKEDSRTDENQHFPQARAVALDTVATDLGGGVVIFGCASVLLRDIRISESWAMRGGGLAAVLQSGQEIVLQDCSIDSNGMNSAITRNNLTLEATSRFEGAGVYVSGVSSSSIRIIGCIFLSNAFSLQRSIVAQGGGLFVVADRASAVTISNCTFLWNTITVLGQANTGEVLGGGMAVVATAASLVAGTSILAERNSLHVSGASNSGLVGLGSSPFALNPFFLKKNRAFCK